MARARRPRGLTAAALLAAASLATAACGGPSGPTADEQAVCDTIQTMIDDLNAGRAEEALTAFAALDPVIADTENETMRSEGARLITATNLPVDFGELTLEEHQELGRRVMEESAGGLDGLIQECDRVGAPIQNLPDGSGTPR